LHVPELAHTVWRILCNGEFMSYAFALGISFSAMVSFIGAAPAIVMGHWHMGETDFAALFVPLICGILGGAFLSGRLAGRITGTKQIGIGYAIALTGGASSVVINLVSDHPPVLMQQVLITVIATGIQMMMPIYALRMLDLFPQSRGSAASVQSCVMLGMGAIFLGGLVPALSYSMLVLCTGAFLAALTGFVVWRIVWRKE
jgi:DHA1 family bicyclomycin/chloramphenicol resistance-like MFS transporter